MMREVLVRVPTPVCHHCYYRASRPESLNHKSAKQIEVFNMLQCVSYQVQGADPILEISLKHLTIHKTMQVRLSDQDVLMCIHFWA